MREFRSSLAVLLLVAIAALAASIADAQDQPPQEPPKPEPPKPPAVAQLNEELLGGLKFRQIGPTSMGGRIADIEAVENEPWIFYVGAAIGGLWKTVNNGITFECVFENFGSISIGDVAIAPSNKDIIWVGTGEANSRNSSSWGDGVYKSVDGGKTWQFMGLKESRHIGRIRIHPKNPDIVYVAALGPLWGKGGERGVFKTEDGGKTWTNTLSLDENTGVVDLVMMPNNPDTLIAAAYQRLRLPWSFYSGGPGSALYRTTDGGKKWAKLDKGLPKGEIGRIGLDVWRKNPKVVYAIIEHRRIETKEGEKPEPDGGVYRSDDGGITWQQMGKHNHRPFYYSQIRIDPRDDKIIWSLGAPLFKSEDGGKNFRSVNIRLHSDHHALWINPNASNHMIIGNDGGLGMTYDGGAKWEFINNLPLGEFYEVQYDMQKPYFVYGGLQDNGSWGGPSATTDISGPAFWHWFNVGGGDGFYVLVDPEDPNVIYSESQGGVVGRVNRATGGYRSIQPRRTEPDERYRFNWNTPLLMSPHNPRIIYMGSQYVHRSVDRGDHWQTISPDLTTNDPEKLKPSGGVTTEIMVAQQHCTVVALAESPLRFGLVWAGTDDGKIHVTRNGGVNWTDVTSNIPDVAPNSYTARLVASRYDEGTCYVAFDDHRRQNFAPYVYVTKDYGQTWKKITKGLPDNESVRALVEDPKNRNLLFLGTEMNLYVSLDAGETWVKFKSNLPTIPMSDLKVHPRDNDLIIGTHGRSIWIGDISPLQQFTPEAQAEDVFLFQPDPVQYWQLARGNQGGMFTAFGGDQDFFAPNPPNGAVIWYYLKSDMDKEVQVVVYDVAGDELRSIDGSQKAGFNSVVWNLRGRGGDGGGRRGGGGAVEPGTYLVKLKVGDKELSRTLRIESKNE